MKYIYLTQDKATKIDDKWYSYLSQWEWYYSNSGYAVRNENGKQILMHRVILNTEKSVDHINRNKLDNQENNLRECNESQNQANSVKKSNNTSGYKGVSFNKQTGKYTAQITVNRTRIHIGYFNTPESAAIAYDLVAKQEFGEYANLNFR